MASSDRVVRDPQLADLLHNAASPVFDNENRRLLVTNHAFFDTDPANWPIVDIFLDEREAPLARPDVSGTERPSRRRDCGSRSEGEQP